MNPHPVLMAIGGGGFRKDLNSCEFYDVIDNVWSEAPPMIHKRRSHSACVVEGKVWVFGGVCEGFPVNMVEMYDPVRRLWEEVGDMPFPLVGSGIGVCDAVSGWDGEDLQQEFEFEFGEDSI